MDSNTHSTWPSESAGPLEQLEPLGWLEAPAHREPLEPPGWLEAPAYPPPPEPPEWLEPLADPERLEWLEPPELPEELAELAAVLDKLAARPRDRSTGPAQLQRAMGLRWLADRLEGQWLQELADLDAAGATATDPQIPSPSTASWLRRRLRMGVGAASEAVRTARALFRGPLVQTADLLLDGQISPAHARVLANGTRQLPDQVAADAEPVLLEAARRLDPPRLRQGVGYLVELADPQGVEVAGQRRHDRRGLWLATTLDEMVSVQGLLEPEAGATVRAALESLARPAAADDDRSADQRNADALTELCRRSLEGGWLPKAGGVRPQLLVTVEYETLLGRPGGLGGDTGWTGPLEPEACRRLACDGTVTRVMVSRHPHQADPDPGHGPDHELGLEGSELQERLRAALALLPPTLGGSPSQPLDVGRASRVITPAQRSALAVRDRGCVFPACERPLAWCDGHHLVSWLDGGPTELGNLAMVCRAHHRTVHEGGWQLTRGPDGRFTATPTDRTRRRHRAVL